MDAPVVVSLTTLPSRIGLMRSSVQSLIDQTRRPDQILVCLPKWSAREQSAYPRPSWIDEWAPLVRVIDVPVDYGPGTKLLGALPHLREEACLVVVDDDHKYRPYFLEKLTTAQFEDRSASFSFWTYRYGKLTIGQGADGFSFMRSNLAGIEAFAERVLKHRALYIHDDVWISAFLYTRGIPVISLEHTKLSRDQQVFEELHAEHQLRHLPGTDARSALTLAAYRALLESGEFGRTEQMKALLKRLVRRMIGR